MIGQGGIGKQHEKKKIRSESDGGRHQKQRIVGGQEDEVFEKSLSLDNGLLRSVRESSPVFYLDPQDWPHRSHPLQGQPKRSLSHRDHHHLTLSGHAKPSHHRRVSPSGSLETLHENERLKQQKQQLQNTNCRMRVELANSQGAGEEGTQKAAKSSEKQIVPARSKSSEMPGYKTTELPPAVAAEIDSFKKCGNLPLIKNSSSSSPKTGGSIPKTEGGFPMTGITQNTSGNRQSGVKSVTSSPVKRGAIAPYLNGATKCLIVCATIFFHCMIYLNSKGKDAKLGFTHYQPQPSSLGPEVK